MTENAHFLPIHRSEKINVGQLIDRTIIFVYHSITPRRVPADAAPGTPSLILFALVMAASTFLIRLILRSGYSFLNMHLGDFPQYILLFTAGTVAAREEWLPKLSFSSGIRWMAVVLPLGFAVWIAILISSGLLSGHLRGLSGGWRWQSAAINVWESFTCVALCFGLLVWFREKFNSHGRLAKFLSDNAFSVYVFHPVFVIAGALAIHAVTWPPVAKFATLTVIAVVFSFVASAAIFRRIPLLREIL